jgi:hypothetical protein
MNGSGDIITSIPSATIENVKSTEDSHGLPCVNSDEFVFWRVIDFANAGDSPENAAIRKQALELCITDSCRKTISQRIARSKF